MIAEEEFPLHRAFRKRIKPRSAEFDQALNTIAKIFVDAEAGELAFNVALDGGVRVEIAVARR